MKTNTIWSPLLAGVLAGVIYSHISLWFAAAAGAATVRQQAGSVLVTSLILGIVTFAVTMVISAVIARGLGAGRSAG